jgi:hypothetical protein
MLNESNFAIKTAIKHKITLQTLSSAHAEGGLHFVLRKFTNVPFTVCMMCIYFFAVVINDKIFVVVAAFYLKIVQGYFFRKTEKVGR